MFSRSRFNMSARFVLLVVMGLAALQLSLATEDLDWGDPQTALWAIARENALVVENQREAAEIVQAAAENATARGNEAVSAHLAGWQSPIDAAVARASNATVEDIERCKRIYDLDYVNANAHNAVPLCVVAARTQYDARVKKLQAGTDQILDLIVKAQSNIETCARHRGELLQKMCLETKLVWTVLTAQDIKSKNVVTYFEVYDNALEGILEDAEACTTAALGRLEFSAQININNTVQCLDDLTSA